MIRWVIRKKLQSVEQQYSVSMDYVRFVLNHSIPMFFKFARMLSVSNCRRTLPASAYHTARIVATRHADCGPCVQFEVNDAKMNGTSPALLEQVLGYQPQQLPSDAACAYRFAEAVSTGAVTLPQERKAVIERFGERGLVELSMAIAACQFFPLLKRGLGFAIPCSKSTVAT